MNTLNTIAEWFAALKIFLYSMIIIFLYLFFLIYMNFDYLECMLNGSSETMEYCNTL